MTYPRSNSQKVETPRLEPSSAGSGPSASTVSDDFFLGLWIWAFAKKERFPAKDQRILSLKLSSFS